MTTNQTIDGVPRGRDALVVLIETFRDALHRGKQPTFSAGDLKFFITEFFELRALLDAPAENVIDVSATDWAAIQEAASESTWMPPEYMRNDWVSDVCRFLREGAAAQLGAEGFYQQVTDADIKKISDYMGNPDMPTGAFLRQDAYDLANMTTHMCREVQALRNKLAAQPQGEPVAWMYRREGGECLGQLVQMESDNLKDVRDGKVVEGRRILWPRDDYTDWKPLYDKQTAPVALLAEAREWLGDGKHSDGMAREHWTPEYAALIDRIDATLRK